MPNATLTQVNAALYALINDIDVTLLPYKYTGFTPAPDGFPFAFPRLKGGKELEADTQYDQAAMDFYIEVVMKDNNDLTTYTNFLALIDAVYAELRLKKNRYLGGLVEDFLISPNCIVFKSVVAQTDVVGFDIVVTALILTDTTL